MEVLFTKTPVTVTNATGDTVLEGHRDPSRNVYIVPLEDSPPPPRVVLPVIDDPIVPCHHTAAKAYEIQAVQVLIAYLHAAARFSAKETWLRVVEANVYSSWPGISLPRLRRHLTEPEPTTFGHLKLIRKDIRSTQPKPIPPATPPRTVHNVGVNVIDTETLASNPELKNLIATSQGVISLYQPEATTSTSSSCAITTAITSMPFQSRLEKPANSSERLPNVTIH